MSGLYENVRSGQKAKKDAGVYVVLAVAVCVLIVGIAFVARLFVNQRRFSKFVSNLSNSTTYAYEHDSLTAEVDGRTIQVSAENMYGLFSYLSMNKAQKEGGKAPEGEPVMLDYGDGSVLRLWDMPAGDGHHDIFVQYTDAQGKAYSYISDKITLEKVAARYLTYGNIEMP